MIQSKTVTRWYVKCQMSVDEIAHTAGWGADEEQMRILVENLKKTWRYVTPIAYEAKICDVKPEKKERKKK